MSHRLGPAGLSGSQWQKGRDRAGLAGGEGGLEIGMQQPGAEKIPSLLAAASARCFLSSLALPGPLRLGTAFGMFPPCAALLSHQPRVTSLVPQSCRHHPPKASFLFFQRRCVSGFVTIAFLFSFCCAVSFWDCRMLYSSAMPKAGVGGTGRYEAVAPGCPRKSVAVL